MSNAEHDVEVLNSLIATVVDSANGYEESAEDIADERLGSAFRDRAAERRQCMTDLQQTVRDLGGKPEDEGTILASLHRKFVDLKSAVTGGDDQAVINEVERGEDHIKHKFEAALEDDGLGATTQAVIRRVFASVKSGHDEMSALKHTLAN